MQAKEGTDRSSAHRISLKETVETKIIPSLRHVAFDGDETNNELNSATKKTKLKGAKSISEVVSLASSGNLLGRVTIDSRHMWIAKRMTQCFGNMNLNKVEAAISSPDFLSRMNEFLGANGRRVLFCMYEPSEPQCLKMEFQPFEIREGKVFYIIRIDDLKNALETAFERKVIVGECNSGIIKSLSLMLQHVYGPLMSAEGNWGVCTDEDRSSFNSSLARFSMTLTDIVYTIDSRVQLKKVDPVLLQSCDLEGNSPEGIRPNLNSELEEIAMDWQKAAESLLHDDDPTLHSLQDIRPDAPLQYWRQRLANLNALNEQFEAPQTTQVLGMLTTLKSSQVKSWRGVETRLREATIEANENVKHLAALDKQFEVLYEGLPSKIAEDLGAVFLKIKRVRVMSKYLQNTENMNGLLVKITNQIIQRCKEYISEGGSLWRQDCNILMAKLKESFELNNHCQVQYRITKHERVGAVRDLPFSFDESRIFAKFELFAARLQKLMDIFEVFGFFKHLASQDTVDLSHICVQYFREVEYFRQRPYDLLDFTETSFEMDYAYMCTVTENLEKELQKVIDEGFEMIESTDQALDLLSEFQKLMPRDSLRPYLNAKHVDIFRSFTQEMDVVSSMYEHQKDDPPVVRHAPPVAGRILWVRHLLRLIEIPMQKFRENGALMISSEAKVIIKKYNKIATALVDYEVLWERAWCSAAESAKLSLNASLLVRHPHDGKLYVNFDKAIVQILRECHYMRKLQITIPLAAYSILERELELKRHADSLEYMLLGFENAERMILPDLKPLLTPLMLEMDRFIQPGLVLLTWTSVNVESYISDVLEFLKRFQDIATKVRDLYENRIQRTLRTISRSLLVSLSDQIVTVDNFAAEQVRVIRERISGVNLKSAEIEIAVKDCINLVMTSLSTVTSAVRPSPRDIVVFYDCVWELVFHAVLASVNRSINLLKDHVRSSLGSGIWSLDRPLFKVSIEIVLQSVKTNPTLEDVQDAINRCALNVLRSVQIKPWNSHQSPKSPETKSIDERVRASKDIVRVVLLLTGSIGKTTTRVSEYLDSLMRFKFLWTDVQEVKTLADTSIEGFIERLSFLDSVSRQVADLPALMSIGPICISHDSFKDFLMASVCEIKTSVCQQHCLLAKSEAESCVEWMHEMAIKMKGGVRDLDDVRNVRAAIKDVISETFEMEQQFGRIDSKYHAAQEFGYVVPQEELALLDTMRSNWTELQQSTNVVSDKLRWAQEGFKSDLLKAIALFHKEVKALYSEFGIEGPNDPSLLPSVGITRLRFFQGKYEEKLPKIAALQEGEELFGLPKSNYPDMEKMKTGLTALSHFYSLYTASSQAIAKYLDLTPLSLSNDLASIEQEIHNFQKKIIQIPKQFWKFVGFKEIKEKVENFILVCPLLSLLTRPDMRPRHWEEVMVVTGTALDFSSPDFTVKNLISVDLLKFRDGIESICITAQKELECEVKVDSINKKWQHAAFTFRNFKNLGPVLLDVGETHLMIESIEESHVALSALMESKYSAHFHGSISELQSSLSILSDLLDLWLEVQRVFCNVEVVFAAEDISKQLPQETSRFQNVTKVFISFIQDAYATRFAMIFLKKEELVRTKLRDLRDQLETSQKFLANHLNAKRNIFPRLFLVPDPMLLEALSLGSDFNSMKHFLACLFDNILCFVRVPQNLRAISGMQSAEGEIVEFACEMHMDSSIETVLASLEGEMKLAIAKFTHLADAHVADAYSMENIENFISNFPGQCCVIGFAFWWSSTCNQVFSQGAKDLSSVLNKLISIQMKASAMISSTTPLKMRMKIQNVVENEVIQRDITSFLVQRQIKDPESFDWLKQIRFRWNYEENTCEVAAMGHTIKHTYEYIGCRPCSSIPCVSNRCYLFLIQSVATFACSALIGTSGCGKSAILNDLGRKLGRYVVEFTCSPELSQLGFTRYLSGICQSGIWGSFDGLERISCDVLSALASSLLCIVDAQRSGKGSFVFHDGEKISLQKSASIFSFLQGENFDKVEAKPLPSNLKSLFRNLTVVPPNCEVFCRVKLTAVRFEHADAIASKIQCLYQMCRQILNHKVYYDFGLRNLSKFVSLLLSSKLHSKDGHYDEYYACATALLTLHLPQLDPQDVLLYRTLLSEIFGQHDLELKRKNQDLDDSMQQFLGSGRMKLSVEIHEKIRQIFDASNSRHCLILVGPTCTGKSLACSLLLQILSKHEECPRKAVFLNPLTMNPEHFFGWFDVKSKEWTDGAFSAVWRRAMRNKMVQTWIVLDGPIDSSWIEYMDTVLGDRKELTLANGDRLPMEETSRIVLEVENLKGASPATIIRTGVINFSESQLILKRMADAWLFGRRQEEADHLRPLFDTFVVPIWDLVCKECRPALSLLPRAQMQNFLALLSILLNSSVIANEIPGKSVLERYVIFSLAWASMGLLNQDDRIKIDKKFAELTSNIPGVKPNKTILDHYLADVDSGQQVWVSIFPNNALRDTNALVGDGHCLTNLFVPSIASESISKLNQVLQMGMYPLFIVGDPGSGKSTIANNCLLESISTNDNFLSSQIVLCRSDSAQHLQDLLCRRVRKRSGRIYGPLQGKKMIILIEDVNLPHTNRWGEHPVSELLRFLLERCSLYNIQKPEEQYEVVDTRLFATVLSLSNGWASLTDRLRRHVFAVYLLNVSKESLKGIFEPILLSRCRNVKGISISSDILTAINFCLDATTDLVLTLQEKIICIHNLHCISRIVQGIIQVRPETLFSPLAVISLWHHECERELMDRLIGFEKAVFQECMQSVCLNHFGVDISSSLINDQTWTNLLPPEISVNTVSLSQYRSISDIDQLIGRSFELLEEFNSNQATISEKLTVVLFSELVAHLVRLLRILCLERGHAVLVSEAREGKSSICQLAAFASSSFLVSRPKSERITAEFLRDDIKKLYLRGGLRGESATMMVQIDHSTQKDVLDIIATAVSNVNTDIFSLEEWGALLIDHGFQAAVDQERALSDSLLTVDAQTLFLHRIRRFVHVVILCSMSPFQFRERVKAIPALTGHCTIDIWQAWSHDSLEAFARKKLDLVADKLELHRVQIANPNIEAELKKKIQDEEEEDVNSGAGLGRWNANDVQQAIVEAIAQEAKLREDLMNKVREIIPVQMARLHASMVTHSQNFHDKYSQNNQSAYCPFVRFCHYSEMFREIFVERFEWIYSRHLKLKLAVEALESCERDITALQSSASTYRSKSKEVTAACDDILEEIKILTTDSEKAKARYSGLESQRRQLEIQLDEMKGITLKHLAHFDGLISEMRGGLSYLTKGLLQELTHLNPPPNLITCVFDVILILLHRRVDPVSTILVRGRPCIKDSWVHTLDMLENHESFLNALRSINYYAITPEQIQLMQPYLSNEDFVVDRAKAVSKGICAPLVKWIRQIESFYADYGKVSKFMSDYQEMEHQQKYLTSAVPVALTAVKQIAEQIDTIRKQYDEAVAKRQLQESADESRELTLKRAQELLKGLKAQKMRWAKELLSLDVERQTLAGNSSMAAGFLTYCGVFTPAYRKQACEVHFPPSCASSRVVCSSQFNVVRFLSDESDIAKFRLQGLPSDEYFDQSALIISRCKMWPLLIDPHEITVKWISKKVKQKAGIDVRVLSVEDESFLSSLQECVRFGVPTLIQGVDTDIQEDIYDLLSIPLRSEGKPCSVRIQSTQVDYNPNFDMFLVTTNAQPKYSESFAASVMVVNFTSQSNLLDIQLLSSILKVEQPVVEGERLMLHISEAGFSVQIQEKRSSLLELVCALDGKVLDKPDIVQQIDQIKTELQVMAKLREENHRKLEKARPIIESYLTLSKRTRKIITCVSRIAQLHKMYMFSMARYLMLIVQTLEDVPSCTDVKDRSHALMLAITSKIHDYVCGSLISNHRPLWTLLLAVHLDKDHGDDCEHQIELLAKPLDLRIGRPKYELELEWMSNESVIGMEEFMNIFPKFRKDGGDGNSFNEVLAMNSKEWEEWYNSEDPEKCFPNLDVFDCQFTNFERLLMVRYLRRDRFQQAALEYASLILGQKFGDSSFSAISSEGPVVLDIQNSFKISDSHTPIIIILNKDLDAVDIIRNAAHEKSIDCKIVPLGQSQKSTAQKLLISGLLLGLWLVFENGHLDISYISSLPAFWQRVGYVQDHFRLFITTEHDAAFPSSLLRMSIMRCSEPPRGLKRTIYHAFDMMDPSFLSCMQDSVWVRLIYVLTFLFAIFRGRIQFGTVGWSLPYEFREFELKESLTLLEIEMAGVSSKSSTGKLNVPWDKLQHIVSDLSLGASVTDTRDRTLFDTYIQRFIAPRVLGMEFEILPSHPIPISSSMPVMLRHILDLPDDDIASMYGLPIIADRQKSEKDSNILLNMASLLRTGKDGVQNSALTQRPTFEDANILQMIEEILISEILSREAWLNEQWSGSAAVSSDQENQVGKAVGRQLQMFLESERVRMQELFGHIKPLLFRYQSQVLSEFCLHEEDMLALECLKLGTVPHAWSKISWKSVSVGHWVRQLKLRFNQLQEWTLKGSLQSYWLGGLFNAAAFTRYFKQGACQHNTWPLESVEVTLEFQHSEAKDDGSVLIQGIYLYGASWDSRAGKLLSQVFRTVLVPGPNLYLTAKRREASDRLRENLNFKIPCFVGCTRNASNFVVEANFPSDEPPQKLIFRSCSVFLDNEAFEHTI